MRAVAFAAALLVAGIVAFAPRGLAELDFRRAESHHRAGDVAKATAACESALRKRPDHPGARALMRILRPPYRCGNSSGDGWALDVIDREIQYGHRFLEGFDLDEAEGQFRLALGLVGVVVPPITGLQAREAAARAGLDRIAAMREDR